MAEQLTPAQQKALDDYRAKKAEEEMRKKEEAAGAPTNKKKGGPICKMARGGGIEQRGKTKGRMV